MIDMWDKLLVLSITMILTIVCSYIVLAAAIITGIHYQEWRDRVAFRKQMKK